MGRYHIQLRHPNVSNERHRHQLILQDLQRQHDLQAAQQRRQLRDRLLQSHQKDFQLIPQHMLVRSKLFCLFWKRL